MKFTQNLDGTQEGRPTRRIPAIYQRHQQRQLIRSKFEPIPRTADRAAEIEFLAAFGWVMETLHGWGYGICHPLLARVAILFHHVDAMTIGRDGVAEFQPRHAHQFGEFLDHLGTEPVKMLTELATAICRNTTGPVRLSENNARKLLRDGQRVMDHIIGFQDAAPNN